MSSILIVILKVLAFVSSDTLAFYSHVSAVRCYVANYIGMGVWLLVSADLTVPSIWDGVDFSGCFLGIDCHLSQIIFVSIIGWCFQMIEILMCIERFHTSAFVCSPLSFGWWEFNLVHSCGWTRFPLGLSLKLGLLKNLRIYRLWLRWPFRLKRNSVHILWLGHVF